MTKSFHVREYVAAALILAFIGAGIWWRASGEPTGAGLVIVSAAALVVVVIFAFGRQRQR
jgi:hypothetical protein